jgi:hypothetical protein
MHTEADDYDNLSYIGGDDLANSTNYQNIGRSWSNNADAGGVGEFYLFAPSSTTYVKHFCITANGENIDLGAASEEIFIGGYWNTATAINAVNFKCDSGNFDGTIQLWGL